MYEDLNLDADDHELSKLGARYMCNYAIVEALTEIREEVKAEHGESGLDEVNQKIKEARDALYK
tara:strand:+ start:61 stop:252 length:192 start_codon:yes stop_codon:yes gene_type:complete